MTSHHAVRSKYPSTDSWISSRPTNRPLGNSPTASSAKWLIISSMSKRPDARNSARTTSSGLITAPPQCSEKRFARVWHRWGRYVWASNLSLSTAGGHNHAVGRDDHVSRRRSDQDTVFSVNDRTFGTQKPATRSEKRTAHASVLM